MYSDDTNTIGDHIIAYLTSARSTRIYFRTLYELRLARKNRRSVQNALYKLKKKNLVTSQDGSWELTKSGKKYAEERLLFGHINSPFAKNSPDKQIISFDIPEEKRKMRDWLRTQLKMFGYRMIQRSLWIGPGPLPQTFKKRLAELGIKENIKVFQLN